MIVWVTKIHGFEECRVLFLPLQGEDDGRGPRTDLLHRYVRLFGTKERILNLNDLARDTPQPEPFGRAFRPIAALIPFAKMLVGSKGKGKAPFALNAKDERWYEIKNIGV